MELTNKELAEQYFNIARYISQDTTSYKAVRQRINRVMFNIIEFYRQNENSLDKMQVEGIGNKTKNLLELILEKGFELAKKEFEAKKKEEFEEKLRKRNRPFFDHENHYGRIIRKPILDDISEDWMTP